MEIPEILEQAKQRLADTTGLKPITITRANKDNEGWHVGLDMLELSRIPTATDVIGDYDVLLTEDGRMLQFERRRTRLRGEPVGDEAGYPLQR